LPSSFNLGDPALVTASLKLCVQPSINNGYRQIPIDQSGSERDHIRVVVLLRKSGGFCVPAYGATDPAELVGDDRLPVAAASQDNATLVQAGRDADRRRPD
jgi:hypothetical protein